MRWHDEHIGSADQVQHVVAEAKEPHGAGEVFSFGDAPQFILQGAFAGEGEHRIGMLLQDVRNRRQQRAVSLVLRQRRDSDQERLAVRDLQ